MAEAKHTPGPWTVFAVGETTAVQAVGPPCDVVKWSGFDDCFRVLAEHRANARLIAAAPDLLEAARALLDAPFGTLGDNDEWDTAMHALDAAVQKATGADDA